MTVQNYNEVRADIVALLDAARTLLAEHRFLDVLLGFVLDNERVLFIKKQLASIGASGETV